MNNKIKKIQNEIHSFINEDDGNIIKNEYGYENIYDVISHVSIKYNVEIKVNCVGEFETPFYGLNFYAWAGIVDGELYFDNSRPECYSI